MARRRSNAHRGGVTRHVLLACCVGALSYFTWALPLAPGPSASAALGWRAVGRVEAEQEVQVTIALKLGADGVRELRRQFLAVSDPLDADFGRHWSRATLASVVAVEPQAQATVQAWLQQRRLRTLGEDEFPGGRTSGFLRVRAAARLVEHAFGVELWTYTRPQEPHSSNLAAEAEDAAIVRVSPVEYDRFVAQNVPGPGGGGSGAAAGVPPALAPHVDFVQGLFEFPLTSQSVNCKINDMEDPCETAQEASVTPFVIRQLYGILGPAVDTLQAYAHARTHARIQTYTHKHTHTGLDNVSASLGPSPSRGSLGSAGAAGFQHQSFNPADVARFVRQNGLHNVSVRRVKGENSGWGHIEGNLDVEYLLSVADAAGADSPISTDYWLSSDFPFGMGFDIVGWAAGVIADDTAALVWSVSYGEALGAVSAGYAQRLDIEMQKLGVLGISVFFASGDSGVYSRSGGYRKFNPTFPACLPSVTAVGATQRNTSGAEDAAADFSGGGFSSEDTFVRARDAPWQIKAVETYLATAALPPAHLWNRDGRCVCLCLCVSASLSLSLSLSV